MNNQSYSKLVISGGGSKGYIMLGALHHAHKLHLLNSVKEYWGVSVGSLIATFLLVGLSPLDIFYIMYTKPLFSTDDINETSLDQLFEGLGICPIESLGDKIKNLLQSYYGEIPTFLELYNKTGKSLNIVGTNLSDLKAEIFNYEKTPDMSIVDALEISCDIPFIFTKKVYKNKEYIDGGFVNEFPIDFADDSNSKILGVWVKSCSSSGNTYFDHVYKPIIATMSELQALRMKELKNNCDCIKIESDILGFTDLNPSKKDKIEMFSTGFKKSEKFFKDKFLDGWTLDFKI